MTLSPATRRVLMRRTRRLLGEHRFGHLMTRLTRWRYKFRRRPRLRVQVVDHVSDDTLYLSGIVDDPKHRITKIELIFDKGSRLRVENAVRRMSGKAGSLSRSNRDQHFVAIVDIADIPKESKPTRLKVTRQNGRPFACKLPDHAAYGSSLDRIREILSSVPAQSPEKRQLFDEFIGPTISRLWEERQRDEGVDELVRFNEHKRSASPRVTLIIPIYGRYDFIEHQLSHFANDADFADYQILYVIDDPRISEAVRGSCETLARLYAISFDVLMLTANLGYAGANNRGAKHAEADRLLLLNSDVFPQSTGWLSALLDRQEQEPTGTLLGARLIYEDGTIQHDGMRFSRSPFQNDLWTNIHPGKGLPADLFEQGATPVDREAVTGACLLVTKHHYLAIGGLDEHYILGDYEDSDLCLRARKLGLLVKLVPSVVLYHLERQSQSLVSEERWKQELTYYNSWLHTKRWDDTITQMKLAA